MDKVFMDHTEVDVMGSIIVNSKEFQILLTRDADEGSDWELSITENIQSEHGGHYYHASESLDECFETVITELIRIEGV